MCARFCAKYLMRLDAFRQTCTFNEKCVKNSSLGPGPFLGPAMTRVSLVERMRRRALIRAVADRADAATARGGRWQCPWMCLRPSRQYSYLDGKKKLGKDLAEALRERYPRAFDIYDSKVWERLEEQTDRQRRSKLHQACEVGLGEKDTTNLLADLADGTIAPKGDELAQVGALVSALEVARNANLAAPMVGLGMRLARKLLLLAGCPMRVWAAEEIWNYCDARVVRHVRHNDLTLRFAPDTWAWFAEHARDVRVRCVRMAFFDPYTSEFPPEVMNALLADLVDGLASTDTARTIRYLRSFGLTSPVRGESNNLDKLQALGLWRPN